METKNTNISVKYRNLSENCRNLLKIYVIYPKFTEFDQNSHEITKFVPELKNYDSENWIISSIELELTGSRERNKWRKKKIKLSGQLIRFQFWENFKQEKNNLSTFLVSLFFLVFLFSLLFVFFSLLSLFLFSFLHLSQSFFFLWRASVCALFMILISILNYIICIIILKRERKKKRRRKK